MYLNPVSRRFPSLEPYQKIAADKIRKQQNQFSKNYAHNIIHKPCRSDNVAQVTYQKTAAHDNKNIKNALHNTYQHCRFSSDAKHFSCFLAFDPNGFLLPLNDIPLTNSKNVGLPFILLTSFCAEKPKLLRANHLYLAM